MKLPHPFGFVQLWTTLTGVAIIGILGLHQCKTQANLRNSTRLLNQSREALTASRQEASTFQNERDVALQKVQDSARRHEYDLARAKERWTREAYGAAVGTKKCLDAEIDLTPRRGAALQQYLVQLQDKCFAPLLAPTLVSQGSALPRVVAVDAASSRKVIFSFSLGPRVASVVTRFEGTLTHRQCCASHGFPVRTFGHSRGRYRYCTPGATVGSDTWESAEREGYGCKNSTSFVSFSKPVPR